MSKVATLRLQEPVQASILAVDPGAISGWALGAPGGLLCQTGSAQTVASRAAVGELFIDLPEPQILVHERGGWRGVTDAHALGMHMGRWLEAVHGYTRSPEFRFGAIAVNPATWRSAFGLYSGMGRDRLKARALEVAAEILGREPADDNEAEAVLILRWAMYSPEVQAAAKRKRRRR
jgi:hypothetical protein